MSIIIRGLDLPENKGRGIAIVFIDCYGTVVSSDTKAILKAEQLPPHYGRLIDGDELEQKMKSRKNYVGRLSDADCLVADAPTIIHADKEE